MLARIAVCALAAVALIVPASASARHVQRAKSAGAAASGPIFEWILLDADTGQVLSEQNADALTYPASLTKMMTLYLTFEMLNQGRIRLDQRFVVSPEAASRAPTKLGFVPGDSVPVRDLILGIVTKSANDAAAVLAEGLAGSESNFARYMNWTARQLGMQHSWYQNASGLPDPGQRTTARDVARLALALYHRFPREYRYFSTREFDFRGEVVHGHNHLLEWYAGADGIKTGFVNASGFNLAASAVRDGRRLIGVIMGGRSARSRDVQMASLLDQGFAVLASHPAPTTAPAHNEAVAAAVLPAAAAAPPVLTAAPARPDTAAVAVAAAADTPSAAHKTGLISHVAQTALKHLAPVGKAEAAPIAHEATDGSDWAVQIGAFRGKAAAERAARQVAHLAAVHGKPQQILAPGRHDASRLYRARLLHFTARGAQSACAELHRKGLACSVVPPSGVRVANR